MRSECILFSFHHIHISFVFYSTIYIQLNLYCIYSPIFSYIFYIFFPARLVCPGNLIYYCDRLYRLLLCARPRSLSKIYPSAPFLLLSLSLLFLLPSSFSWQLDVGRTELRLDQYRVCNFKPSSRRARVQTEPPTILFSMRKIKSKLHSPYNNLVGGCKLVQQLVKYSIQYNNLTTGCKLI